MKWNRYIPYLWTWPFDLPVWLVWLGLWALWGEKLRWEEGSLVFNWKQDSWPARTWYKEWGGTAIGHAVFYNWYVSEETDPEKWEPIKVHEHKHVEQYEASMLGSFILGSLAFIVDAAQGNWLAGVLLGGAIWFGGYLWMGGPNWLLAWVRGKDPYRGSLHEEAAYHADGRNRH